MPAALRLAAAACLAALALASAAEAGDGGRPKYNPFAAAGRAPVCTPAELAAGIATDDCGRMLVAANGSSKSDRKTD
jgi:hypothetical protein